jgi:hypothetical protein
LEGLFHIPGIGRVWHEDRSRMKGKDLAWSADGNGIVATKKLPGKPHTELP